MPELEWTRMDLKEFHESGLLAQANAATFWPLGLALTIQIEEDGSYSELYIQKIEPFDVIVAGDAPEEHEARMNRLAAWMRGRLGA